MNYARFIALWPGFWDNYLSDNHAVYGLMRRKLILCFVYTLLLWLAFGVAWEGSAQAADPLCEDTLFTQMKQRARLQAQMDVARMENFVYKADSILEYTCFDRFMETASANMSYYFTANFINNAIIPMADNWVSNNYSHTSLGGRVNPEILFTPDTNPIYNCDVMDAVWKAAKCLNVDDIAPQDSIVGIFDFMSAPDIRQLPDACAPPINKVATYGATPVGSATPVAINTLPIPPTNCGTPIPTGNMVDFSWATATDAASLHYPTLASGAKKFYVYVCPNPACHYVPTNTNAGTCVPPQP